MLLFDSVSARDCPSGMRTPELKRAFVKETAVSPDRKAIGGVKSKEG
jgi:hypothetical protein